MRIIPVFIINLKKDIQKRAYMKSLCDQFTLHYEFIDAVDGTMLSNEESLQIYDPKKTIKNIGRELSRGEIGCALSHKTIYEKILHDDIEISLILEDDIDFNLELLTLLDLKNEFQQNWELVLLGHHTGYSRNVDTTASIWNQMQLTEKYKLVRPCEKGYGTYGYLITKSGAKKLLNHLNVIERPIDDYTGDSKYVNLYMINPAPVKIHDELSENYTSMKERQLLGNDQTLKTFKDRVRFLLNKLNLLDLFFILKSFFIQFKILKRY